MGAQGAAGAGSVGGAGSAAVGPGGGGGGAAGGLAAHDAARHELGAFLRRQREAADRADYDLPALPRGRKKGLRREEIAFLSGVSVTWYTWLEQGRDIHPSRQVIDAVAVNLRLTAAEHDYVLGLVGFTPAPRPVPVAPAPVPQHVQGVLDMLDPAPAFTLTAHWDIAAWNHAYEGLFPGVATAPPEERNLLLFVFTDDYVRAMLPDWELTSRQFLAEYRAETGQRVSGPEHVRLVEHLRHASTAFRTAWDEHAIGRFSSRRREFIHPEVGDLIFDQANLVPQDAPDLRLVAYLPVEGTGTEHRVRELAGH